DDLERRSWDREEVHRVFDGLEFRVLRERLFATFEVESDEVEGGFDLGGAEFSFDDALAHLGDPLAAKEPHGLVVGRDEVGDAGSLAFAAESGGTAHLDLTALDPDQEAVVARWLADPDAPKALHDAKPQLQALVTRGFALRGIRTDTALAAYLVRPDQRAYDLEDLVVRHLGRELKAEAGPATEGSGTQGLLDFEADDDTTARDAMVRARAVLELSTVLGERLEETGGTGLMHDLELPLVGILAGMERVGIAVDEPALTALEADFDAKMRQAKLDAYDAIGRHDVNLGSPKQLQEVLFDQLGMPKTKRTKTGYTTDADALADLFVKTEHPFLEALLRHRDTARLRVTVEGLIKSVAADRRIHTTYLQTIAATGRLSSTEPNLQNVPIRTEEGRRIREVFVVSEGFESLMSADYSQIEMRIMAYLSGDDGLIEAFRTGEDLHRFVGARVFGVAPADVTLEMRSKVKAMSYGLAYGLSAFGLSKQLTISTGEAQELMDEYFARFGGVRDYLRELVAQARAMGYTATMLGRRRYLPDLTSDNRQRREGAERMALNAPIQGSAADIIKLAMKGVDAALRAEGARSRMLLQVHDELVLEVAPGEREALEALVRREMGSAIDLGEVPLDVSVGVGRSWHDAAH
ncbi:MAG: DNA polymerase I, partial [Dermatophilaceae bacterium]